ncbi:MAG: GNAT family N-acetyltransferase [Opitutales bacterium]|nr:GNAT family N-acetyltransferase [Opitutales bacterium]
MEISIKRTTELTDSEIDEVNSLFKAVFAQDRSRQDFLDRFLNNPRGFSYHSLLRIEGNLIGCESYVPFRYLDHDKPFWTAFGCDIMVREDHRNLANIFKLSETAKRFLVGEGIHLRLGFPNEKMYPVAKKAFRHKDVGALRTHLLVLRVGGIREKFRWFDPVSLLLSRFHLLGSYFSALRRSQPVAFRFRRERSTFDENRERWFGEEYVRVALSGASFLYRIKQQDGARVGFLLDVDPLTPHHFDQAVRHLVKAEGARLDLILFVGTLSFTPFSMMKVPVRWEPKKFRVTCLPLDPNRFDDEICKIENWEMSLFNYDLV